MRVTETDFIKSPARYLEELNDEPIHITRDGWELAVLTRPGDTKKSRRLGCMIGFGTVAKDVDIKAIGREEIAEMFGIEPAEL